MKKVTKFGIIRVEMEGFKKFKEPYSVKLDMNYLVYSNKKDVLQKQINFDNTSELICYYQ